MRIALFSDSIREDLGGLTRATILLHDRLTQAGHAVRVFTLPQTGGPLHPGDVHRVRAIPLRAVPGMPPDSYLAWDYGEVRRELAAWGPDIVHVQTLLPVSWLGLIAARSLGIPVVATYHANIRAAAIALPAGKGLAAVAPPLARAFFNRCDVVIAPSRYAAGELRRLGVRRPVAVISNGIDLDRFAVERPAGAAKAGEGGGSGAAEGSVTVLFAGRLSPEKGVRSAAEALDLALREEPRLLARFAGDGPLADALRQRLAPHLAAGRVSLLGRRPWEAMAAEYARADLLLLPSPAETQGLAALEAMAAGLPVVAARAGALPEWVRDGESGLTVEAGDVPALARAVLRLARDPELRRRLGSGARAVAEEHEAGRVLAQLLALYTGLLDTAPRRREAGQRGAA